MKPLATIYFLLGSFLLFQSACVPFSDAIAENDRIDDGSLLISKTYPVSAVRSLKIETSGGQITVTGDADQEAVLEMHVRANNNRKLSSSEIQEIIDRDYEVTIRQTGNGLEAIAKRKSNISWRNSLNISFTVHTGNKLTSDLVTSGGSIALANLTGNQKFKTSGGSLKIENVKGDIMGKTSGGSVQAYNSEGLINLTTSGGSIKLDDLKGNIYATTSGGSIKGGSISGTLVTQTSGGSINLNNLACKVDASTSGGSVTVSLREIHGDVSLSTSAGSVNLSLPKDSSVDLNLKGFRVNTNQLSNFDGSNQKGRLTGKLNGGGAKVYASTSAGSVNLDLN